MEDDYVYIIFTCAFPHLHLCMEILQKSPPGFALSHCLRGFVQHRNGAVRAESHCWKMRYKGCSLHQNNLTGRDGFPLTFSSGITSIDNKQLGCCGKGIKIRQPGTGSVWGQRCVSHTGVSIHGHPLRELPSPDSEPSGDKDFLCVSPSLPSFSAGFGEWVPEGWARPGARLRCCGVEVALGSSWGPTAWAPAVGVGAHQSHSQDTWAVPWVSADSWLGQ